jgi:Protein of unknown function (DUF5818)
MLMATFKGTIHRSEFGGGFELRADDGETYELVGGAGLADGARVEVTGTIDKGAMSLAMRGPILRVESVKKTG